MYHIVIGYQLTPVFMMSVINYVLKVIWPVDVKLLKGAIKMAFESWILHAIIVFFFFLNNDHTQLVAKKH